MGQARRKALLKIPSEPLRLDQVENVASAIRRLAVAASDRLGADCFVLSALAQAVLVKQGVHTTLAAGFCAVRVGQADGSVIIHAPVPGMVPQPGALPFHCWLETETMILDVTTFTLPAKAKELDKLDGGHTDVVFAPDFLFASKKSVSSLRDTIQLDAGKYHYERQADVEAVVFAKAEPLDPEDVEAAWMLYQNRELEVIGPNDRNRY